MLEGRRCCGVGAPRKAQGAFLGLVSKLLPARSASAEGYLKTAHLLWVTFGKGTADPSGRLGRTFGPQGLQFLAQYAQFVIRGRYFPIALGQGRLGVIEYPTHLRQFSICLGQSRVVGRYRG
jgi:hypothetical protein